MDWLARVLVDARRGWPAYAVVLLLLAAMVALSIRATNFARAEGKPTTAIITSIASLPLGKTYPPRGVRVVATTESGLVGFTHVLPDRVAGCRVGDTISATEVDGSLRLEPWSCERPLATLQRAFRKTIRGIREQTADYRSLYARRDKPQTTDCGRLSKLVEFLKEEDLGNKSAGLY